MEYVIEFFGIQGILATFLAKNNLSDTFQDIPIGKIKLFWNATVN